jgi:hypothetical protein
MGQLIGLRRTSFSGDKKTQREMKHRASGLYFYPYFHIAENPDLLDYLPFIVPPLPAKQYAGFLKHVWRHVYRAVAGARELYIMGYSLPQEDQFARLVIGRAIQRNNSKRKVEENLSL